MRTFFIDDSRKEHTIQFAIEDWWISDFTAFFSTTKAIMNIKVIQDTNLYSISKEDVDSLYIDIPQLETFFLEKKGTRFF